MSAEKIPLQTLPNSFFAAHSGFLIAKQDNRYALVVKSPQPDGSIHHVHFLMELADIVAMRDALNDVEAASGR